MADKIYCGSGKEKFDGNLVEISVCLSDLPKNKIFEYNNKKYIKLKIVKKREIDQYGKSHYVEIDMFEPQQDQVFTKQEAAMPNYEERKQDVYDQAPPPGNDDLPF
jgi:hypothetical protein